MGMLTDEELARLAPAESSLFASPIPVQSVSSDEFMPAPQTPRQREFELRVKAIGSELARHQGVTRRAFFRTSAGMAAAWRWAPSGDIRRLPAFAGLPRRRANDRPPMSCPAASSAQDPACKPGPPSGDAPAGGRRRISPGRSGPFARLPRVDAAITPPLYALLPAGSVLRRMRY